MSWRNYAQSDELRIVRAAETIERRARRLQRRARKAEREARAELVDRSGATDARQPRLRDNAYLAWIRHARCLACAVCGLESRPVDAAHCRLAFADEGWREPGRGRKPDDWKTTPWCRPCHERQGRGERAFWAQLGLYPPEVCRTLRHLYEQWAEPDEAVLEVVLTLSRS